MRTTALFTVLALLLGCGGAEEPADAPSGGRPEVVPDVPGPPPMPPANGDGETSGTGSTASAKPAGVGVGRKGRGYGIGPIATPLKARWTAAERITFDALIPKAMNLYKATHGKLPASHDEFMTEIIQKNQIDLPELPEGERYQYDPEKEQLMVVEGNE